MKYHKLTTTIAFTVILTSLIYGSAHAQNDSSPSPSPTPQEITDEVKDSIKKRLQDSIKNVQDNIVAVVEPSSNRPRAYVGTVNDIIQQSIIINTKDGKKEAFVDSNTTILRSPGNSTIKIEDVRIDDFIIAMGSLKNDEDLQSKRIVVSTTIPSPFSKTSGHGQITKITKNSLTVQGSNGESVLSFNQETIFKSDNGIIKSSDLEENDTVIFVAESENNKLSATVIMSITKMQQTPTSSPSATPHPELDKSL